jgi:flagellar hook protein FlgE
MLRSMYSAISGMRGFQTKLDVIGNNIANVNTTGFKAGRVMFSDVLSQTLAGGSAPTATSANPKSFGGTNPEQIGLGSKVSSIDTIFTDGSLQNTNVPTDLAIQGNGFFVLQDGNGGYVYTRAGNFKWDSNGDLVAANGMRVYVNTNGFTPAFNTQDSNGNNYPGLIPTDAKSVSIAQDGTIKYVDSSGNTQTAGQIQLAVFPNPSGLEKIGDNLYRWDSNASSKDPRLNPTTDFVNPGGPGAGLLAVGFLEMSNVDLANEFTEMIVAQRGFQANSRVITTSDDILQELVNLKRS